MIDRVAIIGGGPAGSYVAAELARVGRNVLLIDEKLAWEKPCGGGITHKALMRYPFLREAQVERNWVDRCELISPARQRVCFSLNQPIPIFSRRVLNGFLLERAKAAGAEIRKARVTRIRGTAGNWRLQMTAGVVDADYIVLAAGARNPFRAQFSSPFAPSDLMATAGYYVSGSSACMQLQFLPGLHGYIWIFPRKDHYSAGICGKLGGMSTAELRRLLETNLSAAGFNFSNAKFYSHVLPSLSASTLRHSAVSGPGWAMVGDAAGLVDPITGEGLYYALRSAELLALASLQNDPESYSCLLEQQILPELEMAARVADRFFTGEWMGEPVPEMMVHYTKTSERFRQLMCDLFAGSQGYQDLRQRLYRTLPAIAAESAVRALGLRRERSRMVSELRSAS
jgi:flavin-dependent dehydrogenase